MLKRKKRVEKEDDIHYSSLVSMKVVKVAGGYADCGKQGTVTAYPGLVTCAECKKILKEEKERH